MINLFPSLYFSIRSAPLMLLQIVSLLILLLFLPLYCEISVDKYQSPMLGDRHLIFHSMYNFSPVNNPLFSHTLILFLFIHHQLYAALNHLCDIFYCFISFEKIFCFFPNNTQKPIICCHARPGSIVYNLVQLRVSSSVSSMSPW